MIAIVNKKAHVPTDSDVFIGRGSVLGNPYTSIPAIKETKAEFRCDTTEESLHKFNEYINKKIFEKDKAICDELNRIWKMVKDGKQVNLVCYCVPKPCHGNIIRNIILSKLRKHKTYSGDLPELKENQILVFGSNTQGRHGKGVALLAKERYGATYGQASGIQGQSYAIITKDLTKDIHPSRTPEEIKKEIAALYDYASWSPAFEFFIPYNCKGGNLNAYSAADMASMFASLPIPANIVFEEKFYELVLTGKPSPRKDIDGLTHVNVYSKGATLLGRLLSNFAETSIKIDDDIFDSVESWWYWIKMKNINESVLVPIFTDEHLEEVKAKPGSSAKEYFRKLFKEDSVQHNPSKEELKKVYILKLEQHPNIKELLFKNTLPFQHYYIMGDKKIEATDYLWTAELWQEIKNELNG